MPINKADKITHQRFNNIADELNELFADTHEGEGPSSLTNVQENAIRWGWGGSAVPSTVRGQKITAALVNELAHRINISTLRTNSSDDEIHIVSRGDTITAEFFNTASSLLQTARAKRNVVDPALTTLHTNRLASDGQRWNSYYENSITLDFGDDNDTSQEKYEKTRHFFNAGGDIRFDYVIESGAGAGYTAWRGVFSNTGTIKFNIDNTVSLNNKGTSQQKGFVELTYDEQLLYTSPVGGGSGGPGGYGSYSSSRLKLYGKIDRSSGRLYFRVLLDHSTIASDVTGVITQTLSITHPTTVTEANVTLAIPDPDYFVVRAWHKSNTTPLPPPPPPTYPTAGTLLRAVCYGYDKFGVYADGTGGEYEELLEPNSEFCNYSPPVYDPAGTLLRETCYGYDKYGVYADGTGGEYEELLEPNSEFCNYSPPVYDPAGTLLRETCYGFDKYGVYADGTGGEYEEFIESNSTYCGFSGGSDGGAGGAGE